MRWLKNPPVWIGLCLLVLAAIALSQVPRATEVTLHVVTESLAFVLPAMASQQPLIQGLPLTSLSLHGLTSLVLEVKEVRQQDALLAIPGTRLKLYTQQPATSYTLRASPEGEVRLVRLSVAGNSAVLLSTDQIDQLQMDVKSPQAITLELAIVGQRFTLVVDDDVVLLDEQGQELSLPVVASPRTLEVTPVSSRLFVEQQADTPIGLDMRISAQPDTATIAELSRAFGRLRLTRVTFPRRGSSPIPREAVIKEFWGEPLVPQDKPRTQVVMQLQENDEFTLQALKFSPQGLVCELAGMTKTVRVGKEKAHENLVPSWLDYIANHIVWKTVCKPLGLC
jgi:hypothetical protein